MVTEQRKIKNAWAGELTASDKCDDSGTPR